MKAVSSLSHRSKPTNGSKPRSTAAGRIRFRVGVLPFLGGDAPNDEELSASVSRDIAAELTQVHWLDVIPPVALMHQAASGRGDEAAQSHDLSYIVDGAVSCDGKRLQVSVRLVDLTEYARTL